MNWAPKLARNLGEPQTCGNGDHGDQRHGGRQIHHHRDHADGGEQRRQQLPQSLTQTLRQVVDVVGDAADQLAPRVAIEVAERQPVELVFDLRPHPQHC